MQKFIKKAIVLLVIIFSTTVIYSNEQRNHLSGNHTRKTVYESLRGGSGWVTYPAYTDRKAWAKIPQGIREATIDRGEEYLGYNWPPTTATMYLEFIRNGNRSVVDGAIRQRLTALRALTMAELMEGEGRFLDDLINGVFAFCEQTYWGMSATFYMYKTGFQGHDKPNTVLPDIEDPIVDLSAGDAAADLAWIWHFFHEAFDGVSPVIAKRLKSELKKKILEPYYERFDFWWITGWDEGRVNNWNPWCNHNMLTCILLIEDDQVKKHTAIYKSMQSVDLFINSYPDDGACDEGPNYWAVAGGKLFDYLDMLHKATNGRVDIFRHEIVRNIGKYIYRVYIANSDKGQYYANYSDAPAISNHDPGRIIRYGKAINDTDMEVFGHFLLGNSTWNDRPASGRIGEALENLFNIPAMDKQKVYEPLLSDYYFPDREIAIARDGNHNNGFCFVAKGGSNGEGHNHNDVGSFMLFYKAKPFFVDVGVGTYTAKTFSPRRYEIWTMQSEYHNLPVINGYGQSPGGRFKASNAQFKAAPRSVVFTTDISKAYPEGAKVDLWERTYSLERGKRFMISDSYRLGEVSEAMRLNFMTPASCRLVQEGILELTVEDVKIQLTYDPAKLTFSSEAIELDDPNLKRVWGEKLTRIVFNITSTKPNNEVLLNLTPLL